MCFYYAPVELCSALKAWLHEYILKKTDAPSWFYLDSDLFFVDALDEAVEALSSAAILLTPHLLRPVKDRFIHRLEVSRLVYGVYNGGFMGIRRCETAGQFLSWFKERMQLYALHVPSVGQFGDQLMLDYVPAFFRDTGVVTHPGANVGRWNLHERQLSQTAEGRYLANGQPLLFSHMSAFDFDAPEKFLARSQRYLESRNESWEKLTWQYREALVACGHETWRKVPYPFSAFQGGQPITSAMRRYYLQALLEGRGDFQGSPFENYQWFQRHLKGLRGLTRKIANHFRRSERSRLEPRS